MTLAASFASLEAIYEQYLSGIQIFVELMWAALPWLKLHKVWRPSCWELTR